MSKYNTTEFASLKNIKSKTGAYRLPVSWRVYSTIEVVADNLLDALQKAEAVIDDIPLGDPDEVEFIDGSYRIDVDSVEDAENAQLSQHISTILIWEDGSISHP